MFNQNLLLVSIVYHTVDEETFIRIAESQLYYSKFKNNAWY